MHEAQLDCAYPSIHHITWRNDVSTRTSVRNGHLGDALCGSFCIEGRRVRVNGVWVVRDDTAVACRGVLA
jgi:hypothetical protein